MMKVQNEHNLFTDGASRAISAEVLVNIARTIRAYAVFGFRTIVILVAIAVMAPISLCRAEQSLIFPLHYADDLTFYRDVATSPLARRILVENGGSSISFDTFHMTGYNDSLFFERHKLILVNDSSSGHSIAVIACILNGDEAIEFSRRLITVNTANAQELHPWGFANLRIFGIMNRYKVGHGSEIGIVVNIDPCHLDGSVYSGRQGRYSIIRAPKWSMHNAPLAEDY
jgi:hypothetical protein